MQGNRRLREVWQWLPALLRAQSFYATHPLAQFANRPRSKRRALFKRFKMYAYPIKPNCVFVAVTQKDNRRMRMPRIPRGGYFPHMD